jgi:hypothetical protein
MSRIAPLSAALLMAFACGGPAPTTPSPGTSLALTCSASTLLAGGTVVCKATVGLMNVGLGGREGGSIWTSSDPNVATSLGGGLFRGKSDGQTTLTATYSGQSVSAPLTVHLQDVIRATAAAFGGTFEVGWIVTLWLQGFYGVASVDSCTLTLVITDQAGVTVRHKRTAHGSARWRQLPDLDHVHDTARHHACVSDGSPSDRFDDVDGGSGRLTCAVHLDRAVTDRSDAAAKSEPNRPGNLLPETPAKIVPRRSVAVGRAPGDGGQYRRCHNLYLRLESRLVRNAEELTGAADEISQPSYDAERKELEGRSGRVSFRVSSRWDSRHHKAKGGKRLQNRFERKRRR